jgi:GT2 family glycosyltransferase
MALEVTVSLVSHNQRFDLERLLPSLMSAVSLVQSQILLVDNRSTDGTTEFVQHHFPIIQITGNPKKSGYGENHNLNLRKAVGRYFVIMNSDMNLDTDVFVVLRDFMNEHADVGIVSPKILNGDGSIQGLNKRYPTIFDLFLRRFLPQSLRHFFQRRLDYYEMRDIGYNHIYDVPFLSGAFMFCRTDLLKLLGGFDSGYFLYFEDVDLCRRVQRTHRTVYCPHVCVRHFWERSAHNNWVYTFYFIKSAFRYFGRWGYRFL